MRREAEYAISEFSRAIVVEPHFVSEGFRNSKIAYYENCLMTFNIFSTLTIVFC